MTILESGAFDVPRQYQKLLEFSVGLVGWFVPDEVRHEADKAMREIVYLRSVVHGLKEKVKASKELVN